MDRRKMHTRAICRKSAAAPREGVCAEDCRMERPTRQSCHLRACQGVDLHDTRAQPLEPATPVREALRVVICQWIMPRLGGGRSETSQVRRLSNSPVVSQCRMFANFRQAPSVDVLIGDHFLAFWNLLPWNDAFSSCSSFVEFARHACKKGREN